MQQKSYGVSPAYFISSYGFGFTPADVCRSLPELKTIGFDNFQTEVVHEDTLPQWLNGGAQLVGQTARDLGLEISQFVSHFMLPAFAGLDVSESDWGLSEMRSVFELTALYKPKLLVVIPLADVPVYPRDSDEYYRLYDATVKKFRTIAELAAQSGNMLSVEVQPRSVIHGGREIKQFCEDVGFEMGYNFDSGHAWAGRNNLLEIIFALRGRIYGTHLCDNFGTVNLSNRPGDGTISWEPVLKALLNSGYEGTLDLEIGTSPEKVISEYTDGLCFIKEFVNEISRENLT